MSEKDDDLEIIIAEDEPVASPRKDLEPDEGIEALREQLAKSKETEIVLRREAQAAQADAYVANAQKKETEIHLLSGAIDQVRANAEILIQNLAMYNAQGDYEAVARCQSEMSLNAARLMQLEQGKEAMESAPPPPPPRAAPAGDPVEQMAATLSYKSAQWLRQHPECATDSERFNLMMAAHTLAIAKKIPVDSPEYFDTINDTMGYNQGRQLHNDDLEITIDDPTSQAAKVTQSRSAPPAAPVSRTGTAPGVNPNSVRLTPAQREAARDSGLSEKEYAQNLVELRKAGRLN